MWTCALFPRTEMRVVGIAPLTSMFLFDETNRGRLDDYRPEVHDSDGLMIESKSGEHIFRQLANPIKLQVSSFTTEAPLGFGLVQRSREQSDFQDFDAQYERRPSAWIEPKGEWGAGGVELVEIPSGRESNDNIVAFWRPAQSLTPGHPAHYAYRIVWCAEPALPKSLGKVVATRSGASLDGKRRVFLLDFVGAGEKVDGLHLDLGASAGRISNATLMSNSALHGLRASFELDPTRCRSDRNALADHARRSPDQRNLAVSMDLQLNSAAALEPQMTSGGMPPENPVYMPPQDLGYRPPRRPRHWSGAAVLYARFILIAITWA